MINWLKMLMLFTLQTTDTSNLIPKTKKKKKDYETKAGEIKKKILDYNHDKYITTEEYNNLTAENFAARLELKADISNQTKLATKAGIADFLKKQKSYFK